MAKCGRPQNSNFYQNFQSSFSVLCAKRQHSTQQLIIDNSITDVSESFVVRYKSYCLLFMWTKFGLELQKIKMRTSGGGQ